MMKTKEASYTTLGKLPLLNPALEGIVKGLTSTSPTIMEQTIPIPFLFFFKLTMKQSIQYEWLPK